MKHINNLTDLQQFGIVALTGEACALGRRMLYDLTYQGLRAFCMANGMSVPLDPMHLQREADTGERFKVWNLIRTMFAMPMNRCASDHDEMIVSTLHVASVMVGCREWQPLGIFALLLDGAAEVIAIEDDTRLTGFYLGDQEARQVVSDYAQMPTRRAYSTTCSEIYERAAQKNQALIALHNRMCSPEFTSAVDTVEEFRKLEVDRAALHVELSGQLHGLYEDLAWCRDLVAAEGRHGMRYYRLRYKPGIASGDRNVHQMTGRIQ